MNHALIEVRASPDAVSTRGSSEAQFRERAQISWWQWPHLLSLDAPLVAVVWQRWWMHSTGIGLPASREWILGLGVWMIYLADRLADTAHCVDASGRTARHAFSSRRRGVLLPLVCGIGLAVTILSLFRVPSGELVPGLGLLALAVAYFWLIHRWPHREWAAYLPKEAAVGAMFGAGTIFFVVCRASHLTTAFWTASVLFSAVCFLNCALITKWERHAQDLHEPSSLLNSFPFFSAHLRGACLLLASLAVALSAATGSRFAAPVAISALLLACLDWFDSKVSVETRRICADLVLLTPIFGCVGLPAFF